MSRKLTSSKWPGVLYRQHENRKHGKQFDCYWVVYYRWNGKNYQEALGWTSQGWSGLKAAGVLGEIKQNQRRGEGPSTLAEKRAIETKKRHIEEVKGITFDSFWRDNYLPAQDVKSDKALVREKSFYNAWFKDALGSYTLDAISELTIEKLKRDMLKAGRAPRTVEYALAVIRQVWNLAQRRGFTDKQWPGRFVKKPKADNKRVAFFTQEQAQSLLDELNKRAPQWHDITLLSIHSGLRAGEIFNLLWEDIDLIQKTIHVRDPKSGRDRFAHMTREVFDMLSALHQVRTSSFVFCDRHGNKLKDVSDTFRRAIDKLGLNEGITDTRHKLTFHSCRHTFASWAAMAGVELFTLQKMLGHETAAMTARYAHLLPERARTATRLLDGTLTGRPGKVVNLREAAQ